ncbi:MAG: efflux transporter outer membrane subunit [Verrucomicrobia bacterium]|nr:efflux transporter outer membrane subunit [Verrucomicrobiota bacterium]
MLIRHDFLRSACLISLVCSSCTVGPDFKLPEMKLTSRWKQQADVSDLALPDQWWTLFKNSTLNGLVERALLYNQDLASAEARVATAKAMLGVERAAWFPQLSMDNRAAYEQLSANSIGANLPPGVPLPSLERDRHQAFLNLNYEVDLWGKVRRSVEASKARETASVDNLAAQRLVVAAEVSRSFFQIASLDTQEHVLQETIALRQESLSLQQSRFQGGLANEMDVARSRTELELAKNDKINIERQRGNAENALAVLCGELPSSFRLAKSHHLPSPPRISTGVPSTLLQRRPDIRAAEQAMREANANVGVAKANFYPAFSLVGNGGLESVGAEDFIEWKSRTANIGPQLSIPIFQGGRLRGNMRSAQAKHQESVAAYRQSILTALGEVENAMLDVNAYGRQRAAVSAAVAASQETSKLARLRYEKGLASYFEVVDADRTVLTTRLLQAQLDGQRLTATVQMIRALGGGWK